jgi:putative nucleic acid modification protein with dual OB domain
MNKTIICLANSRKITARCIAGKDLDDGSWVRPVSNRDTHEISEEDRRYQDGSTAQLLDKITIPFLQYQPHGHQPENILIDDQYYWTKVGEATFDELEEFIDDGPLPWPNNYSTQGKINDRVPEALLNQQPASLRFVFVDNVTIMVENKTLYGSALEKRAVRAAFQHRGTQYCLDVTDTVIERRYLQMGIGQYSINNAYLCISLGEVFYGYAYKLVSSIIVR